MSRLSSSGSGGGGGGSGSSGSGGGGNSSSDGSRGLGSESYTVGLACRRFVYASAAYAIRSFNFASLFLNR